MTSKAFGAKNIDVSSDLNVSGVGTFTTGLDLDGYLKDKDDERGSNGQILKSTGDKVKWVDLSVISSDSGGTGIGFTDLNDTPSALGSAGQLVAVNSGATELEFKDFSAPNLGSGALPSNVTILQSQITNPLTYQLKARPDEDGGSTGDDNDPYLFLDASTGTDDAVQLFGGSSVSIERDSNKKIIISVPTEGIQDIVGGMVDGSTQTNIAVTYDDSNGKLNFAATDNDTNHFLSSVTVDSPTSGATASTVTFTRNDSTSFTAPTFDNLRVRHIYNYKMSDNPESATIDPTDQEYQFMLTSPVAGYRRVATDTTARFKITNNRVFFSRLTVDNGFQAGSVNSTVKSFVIDHPLGELTDAPKLRHSCIEGPELATFYRGKIQLVDGTATINIDTVSRMTEGTFVALNRNIQSFTTNETGWTLVKSSVSGNVLTIIAQDSNCTDTISWMVLGERKDNAAIKTYNENGLYDPEQVTEDD